MRSQYDPEASKVRNSLWPSLNFSFLTVNKGRQKYQVWTMKCSGTHSSDDSIPFYCGPSLFPQDCTHLTSTSGLLCLSTTCDEKSSRHMAAVSVCLTAVR